MHSTFATKLAELTSAESIVPSPTGSRAIGEFILVGIRARHQAVRQKSIQIASMP
jgi:hypothetical protein